jgi:hypothetical protein
MSRPRSGGGLRGHESIGVPQYVQRNPTMLDGVPNIIADLGDDFRYEPGLVLETPPAHRQPHRAPAMTVTNLAGPARGRTSQVRHDSV